MPATFFEEVGGEPFFERLVGAFYESVEDNELLRSMYPEDLTESRRHLELFLAQYWGGPPTYMEERGHPRLRMRHAHWVIGERERDAWLGHMQSALDSLEVPDDARAAIWEHLERAAHSLVNSPSFSSGGDDGR